MAQCASPTSARSASSCPSPPRVRVQLIASTVTSLLNKISIRIRGVVALSSLPVATSDDSITSNNDVLIFLLLPSIFFTPIADRRFPMGNLLFSFSERHVARCNALLQFHQVQLLHFSHLLEFDSLWLLMTSHCTGHATIEGSLLYTLQAIDIASLK